MAESRPVRVQRRLHPSRTAQQIAEQPAQVGQVTGRAGALQEAQGADVVLLGGLGVAGVLGDDAEEAVGGGGVQGAALGAEVAEHLVEEGGGLVGLAAPVQYVGEFDGDLAGVEGGALGGQHGLGLAQFGFGALQVAVLGVDVAAHPVAVGEFGADLELAVQLGGLGEGGVGLGDPAFGEQGAGDGPVHTGDQGGVRGLRGEGEGVLGGLGGAGVGAHVHVGADDAGVEQQEGVGVVQSAAVELVEGGFDEVDGVAQFTGEVVGHGPAAQRGHPGGQRGVGVREDLPGPLEVPPGGVDFPDVDVAVAEPEQRRRPFLGEPVRVRLREQRGVLLGRGLGLAGGEGALGFGQSHPQGRDEVRGPSGGELLEGDAEPVGDMP